MSRTVALGALVLFWGFSCSVDSEPPVADLSEQGGAGGEAGAVTTAGQGNGVEGGAPSSAGSTASSAGASADSGGVGSTASSAGASADSGGGNGNGGVGASGGAAGAMDEASDVGGAGAGGASSSAGEGGASGGAATAGAGGVAAVSCPEAVAPPTIEVGDDLAPLCAPSNYTSTPDIAYASGDIHMLDLRVPKGLSDPAPLVIWLHGSGWRAGSRTEAAQALRLLCRGYAVASIEYRLSTEAKFPAQIVDVKAAVRYLRAQAETLGIDPDRFAAFGSSAGGHLAALLGTSAAVAEWDDPALGNVGVSSAVQAVVDWYGPILFSEIDADLDAQGCLPITQDHGLATSAESELLGCTIAEPECAEEIMSASPLTYVTAASPPFLIMHGSADCLSSVGQSQRLNDTLLAAGACSSFHVLTGVGHNSPDWETPEPQGAVADFLDSVL